MKKIIGQVLPEERDEIRRLFERKNGLVELSKILTADNEILYEKVVIDLGATNLEFQEWWMRKAEKYQWESCERGNWEIDFENCDIYLNDNVSDS